MIEKAKFIFARVCEKVHIIRTRLVLINISAAFFAILTLFFTPSVYAQPALSVPAEFVRDLKMPGTMNGFLRPGKIYIDRNAGEILVADLGHGRIVIFDDAGAYKFEFITSNECGIPEDIAVDKQGNIYVLGSNAESRAVFIYDYTGRFTGTIPLSLDSAELSHRCIGLTIDSLDRLYTLDATALRINRYSTDGLREHTFSILSCLEDKQKTDLVFGSISINSNALYIPVGSLGTVFVYSLDGDSLPTVGFGGNDVGELGFPVAVEIYDNQMIMVLDKHRFNVICFSKNGKFLGEFGGKGTGPGWFYHPTLLALDKRGQVYIGQIFNNKIQVCKIPASILERLAQSMSDPQNRQIQSQSNTAALKRSQIINDVKKQEINLLSTHFNSTSWRFHNA